MVHDPGRRISRAPTAILGSGLPCGTASIGSFRGQTGSTGQAGSNSARSLRLPTGSQAGVARFCPNVNLHDLVAGRMTPSGLAVALRRGPGFVPGSHSTGTLSCRPETITAPRWETGKPATADRKFRRVAIPFFGVVRIIVIACVFQRPRSGCHALRGRSFCSTFPGRVHPGRNSFHTSFNRAGDGLQLERGNRERETRERPAGRVLREVSILGVMRYSTGSSASADLQAVSSDIPPTRRGRRRRRSVASATGVRD